MSSVLQEYGKLWPEESLRVLGPMLSSVLVAHFPRDAQMLKKLDAGNIVIVTDQAPIKDLIPLFEAGYGHCVQEGREDFAQELLASSLMVHRPLAFLRQPITFFFNGFQTFQAAEQKGRHIKLKFSSSTEKDLVLERLGGFLDNSSAMAAIKDICLQTADELITNAIFNAPVRTSGVRLNDRVERSEITFLPDGKSATLFSCFSDDRVIVGCEDPFGSLTHKELMTHLSSVYKEGSAVVRRSGAGAGLGFRFMIENSANLYFLSTRGHRTLVACGFLLKGLRANLTAGKHFHFSFT